MTERTFLSIREVAERSGLSRSFLYRAVEAGSLPCYRPSRRKVLIRWSEFEQWLAQFQQKGTVIGARRTRERPVRASRPPESVSSGAALLPFTDSEKREVAS